MLRSPSRKGSTSFSPKDPRSREQTQGHPQPRENDAGQGHRLLLTFRPRPEVLPLQARGAVWRFRFFWRSFCSMAPSSRSAGQWRSRPRSASSCTINRTGISRFPRWFVGPHVGGVRQGEGAPRRASGPPRLEAVALSEVHRVSAALAGRLSRGLPPEEVLWSYADPEAFPGVHPGLRRSGDQKRTTPRKRSSSRRRGRKIPSRRISGNGRRREQDRGPPPS